MGLQPVLETDTVMVLARGIESSNDNDVLICTWTKFRIASSCRSYFTFVVIQVVVRVNLLVTKRPHATDLDSSAALIYPTTSPHPKAPPPPDHCPCKKEYQTHTSQQYLHQQISHPQNASP